MGVKATKKTTTKKATAKKTLAVRSKDGKKLAGSISLGGKTAPKPKISVAKKDKVEGISLKKTHLTNEEVKKQVTQAYEDCHEIARKIRNENILRINALRAEEESNLKALLEANQGFANFFRRGFYDRKSFRRRTDIRLEVEAEEKRVISKIYDELNYKTVPRIEAQYNNGQGLRRTSPYEVNHSRSSSSNDSGSAWLS